MQLILSVVSLTSVPHSLLAQLTDYKSKSIVKFIWLDLCQNQATVNLIYRSFLNLLGDNSLLTRYTTYGQSSFLIAPLIQASSLPVSISSVEPVSQARWRSLRSVYRFHILLIFTCETLRKQFLVLRKGFFSCGHIEYEANYRKGSASYKTTTVINRHEMDNLVFRAWLPSYPGLVTNVNHFTSIEPPVTKFPCGVRFCLFFFFFFAAAVGPDENRERSKKVWPFLRRE